MYKAYYDYVFVVLVYKNTDVLKYYFEKFELANAKVIVVNSFFDYESFTRCEFLAKTYNADFIAIENKGYGYGNNIGTEYALKNYSFKYLIISNSDVILKDISDLELIKEDCAIIAPETKMQTGKNQNPDTPWKLPFLFDLTHWALTNNWQWLYLLTRIYTRLSRELFIIYTKINRRIKYSIFSAHGSFIIFTYKAAEQLYPFFNNDMFLYNEEWFLAMKARVSNVPVYFYPSVKILHLEGASSDTRYNVFFKKNKQSYDVFYNWIKSLKKYKYVRKKISSLQSLRNGHNRP